MCSDFLFDTWLTITLIKREVIIIYLYYKRVDPYLWLPFWKALGVAADTHGTVLASTVFVPYSLHVLIVGLFYTS